MLETSSREQRKILGDLLAAERKKLKISQAIAAERLGVTKGAYQAWEQGKSMPDSGRQQTIARFLGFKSTSEFWQVLEGTVNYEEVQNRSYEAILEALAAMPKEQLSQLNLIIAQRMMEKV
jgi:transcriptional regulator with XRE-family HTH domain